MAFALNLSLAVLVYVACAACADDCASASWGNSSGTPIQLPSKELSSGVRDWTVTIPIPPQCKKVNGIMSTVCDPDPSRPDLNYQQQLSLIVHRNSNLVHPATVTITVYCDV